MVIVAYADIAVVGDYKGGRGIFQGAQEVPLTSVQRPLLPKSSADANNASQASVLSSVSPVVPFPQLIA